MGGDSTVRGDRGRIRIRISICSWEPDPEPGLGRERRTGNLAASVSSRLSCAFHPDCICLAQGVFLYIPWQGRLPRFPLRTTSTESSNINIPPPNKSSEPALVLWVFQQSKSQHSGHYSSTEGFRLRNLDTATMASLFFCCLAHGSLKKLCLDGSQPSLSAPTETERKRATRPPTTTTFFPEATNILPWKTIKLSAEVQCLTSRPSERFCVH